MTNSPLHPPLPSLSRLTACLLIIAAITLGAAINVREGLYQGVALLILNLAVAAIIVAGFNIPAISSPFLRERLPITLLCIGIGLQFIQLWSGPPGTVENAKWTEHGMNAAPFSMPGRLFDWSFQRTVHDDLFDSQKSLKAEHDPKRVWQLQNRIDRILATFRAIRFQMGLLVLAGITVWAIRDRRWPVFGLLLFIHFLLGVYIIAKTPKPYIDVHVFQQEASAALFSGKNPYSITMPNIYGADSFVYAQDLMTGDRLKFGYPYTPLSLYMALPGYVVGKDHRYSQLAAITLSAILIAASAPTLSARLAAILLLSTPRLFTVVELAWTEPFVILTAAATVFCAARAPRLLPFALGLFLASKQYTVFVAPLVALLLPRPFSWIAWLKVLAIACLTGFLISAPLVFWDFPGFWFSSIKLQFGQPFRADSLSYLAWVNYHFLKDPSIAGKYWWVAFAAVVPATLLALWRMTRTPAGFAAGLALVYTAFLVTNKQAFCNYYFFVIALLCCAIATAEVTERVVTSPAPPPDPLPAEAGPP